MLLVKIFTNTFHLVYHTTGYSASPVFLLQIDYHYNLCYSIDGTRKLPFPNRKFFAV